MKKIKRMLAWDSWDSPVPETRLKAIRDGKLTDQEELKRIAAQDQYAEIRAAALYYIKDDNYLASYAMQIKNEDLTRTAISRIGDENVKAAIVLQTTDDSVRDCALGILKKPLSAIIEAALWQSGNPGVRAYVALGKDDDNLKNDIAAEYMNYKKAHPGYKSRYGDRLNSEVESKRQKDIAERKEKRYSAVFNMHDPDDMELECINIMSIGKFDKQDRYFLEACLTEGGMRDQKLISRIITENAMKLDYSFPRERAKDFMKELDAEHLMQVFRESKIEGVYLAALELADVPDAEKLEALKFKMPSSEMYDVALRNLKTEEGILEMLSWISFRNLRSGTIEYLAQRLCKDDADTAEKIIRSDDYPLYIRSSVLDRIARENFAGKLPDAAKHAELVKELSALLMEEAKTSGNYDADKVKEVLASVDYRGNSFVTEENGFKTWTDEYEDEDQFGRNTVTTYHASYGGEKFRL